MPALSMKRRENLAFLFFVTPNLVGVLLFTAIPVLVGFGLSFTDWDMLSESDEVESFERCYAWSDHGSSVQNATSRPFIISPSTKRKSMLEARRTT